MSAEFEKDEYFALMKSITDADQRLLTVKGWGVTLSLAALGFGFQYRAYGFFMIAAVSSIAFWIVEHAGRRHLMRHYVRMREIEVAQYLRAAADEKDRSSPRIDWSWYSASKILAGRSDGDARPVVPRERNRWYGMAWALPHVALPHALTLLVSALLILQGVRGELENFSLGTATPAAAAKRRRPSPHRA